MSDEPRETCGSPCPRHEHACARPESHGGQRRDRREKDTEGCSRGPGDTGTSHATSWLVGREVPGER